MVLTPLRQWFCDRCHQVIEKPSEGALVWFEDRTDEIGKYHSFQIVHKPYKSPSYPERQMGCFPDEISYDVPLNQLAGPRGINELVSMFGRGVYLDPDGIYRDRVRDTSEWLEVALRLLTPYYEQARTFFRQARDEGELSPEGEEYFTEDWLIRLIQRYTGEDLGEQHSAACDRLGGEPD